MRHEHIKHKLMKGLGPVATNGNFMENHLPTTESSFSPPFMAPESSFGQHYLVWVSSNVQEKWTKLN